MDDQDFYSDWDEVYHDDVGRQLLEDDERHQKFVELQMKIDASRQMFNGLEEFLHTYDNHRDVIELSENLESVLNEIYDRLDKQIGTLQDELGVL